MANCLSRKRSVCRLVVYLALATFASACTTMQPLSITNNAPVAERLKPGDKVSIVTHAGDTMEFVVNDVSESGISGSGQFVAFSDMREIRIKNVSIARTLGLIIAINAVFAVALKESGAVNPLEYRQ